MLVVGVPQLLRQLPSFSISLFGKEISPVPVAKDLGVQLDQNLSFNEHIVKTSSNCMHKLVQINRIKHLLDRKTLMLLINAFVFSKLFYCSTVWSNTCKTNVKKFQLVQNFAARMLPKWYTKMASAYQTIQNSQFLNYHYFSKIRGIKPKIDKLTNSTQLYPSLE